VQEPGVKPGLSDARALEALMRLCTVDAFGKPKPNPICPFIHMKVRVIWFC
jgi:hypothetical protein